MATRLVVGLCLLATTSLARNLEERVGLGISFQDFNNIAALSLRYHFSKYVSATFLAGFDTQSDSNATILGMKVYRNANLEENLNFYVGAAGFIIADKAGNPSTSSGIEIDGLIGAEFFLPGIYNLAFQFEAGVALRTVRELSFKTIGGTFSSAGIHYYF